MKISHGRLYCEEVNRKRNEPLQIESHLSTQIIDKRHERNRTRSLNCSF